MRHLLALPLVLISAPSLGAEFGYPPVVTQERVYEERRTWKETYSTPLPVPRPPEPPSPFWTSCLRGIVWNLQASPYGIEVLALREGPSVEYRQLTALYNGHRLLVCGEWGPWLWVAACEPFIPEDSVICPRGWAHSKWIVPTS